MVSERAWRKVPRRLHGPLAEAASRAAERIRTTVRADSEEAMTIMKSYGLSVSRVSDEEVAIWRQEVQKSFSAMIGSYIDAALVREIEETLVAYRARN